MISKPSRTWTLLSRTLAACLEALDADDFSDLCEMVERESNRRFLLSSEADPMDVGRRWCAPRDRWLGEGP
jgi:hypothetical protein